MKKFDKPPFKEKALAIGFSLSVNAIVIVGLIYLGMGTSPKPPEKMRTILIQPEDLQPQIVEEKTIVEETAQTNVAKEITQTAEPAPIAPNIPITAPIQPNLTQNLAQQEKADTEAKRKAEAQEKANIEAKRKAEVQEKANAEAKRKAEAQEKANAEAKRKAEEEARLSAAKKASEEAANKKSESKKIASSAKKDFEDKIRRAWNRPSGSAGQKATARVTLSDSGAVLSVVVNASDPDMKASIEAAVRAAAPYPMPADPDARRQAKSFSSTFISQ